MMDVRIHELLVLMLCFSHDVYPATTPFPSLQFAVDISTTDTAATLTWQAPLTVNMNSECMYVCAVLFIAF